MDVEFKLDSPTAFLVLESIARLYYTRRYYSLVCICMLMCIIIDSFLLYLRLLLILVENSCLYSHSLNFLVVFSKVSNRLILYAID